MAFSPGFLLQCNNLTSQFTLTQEGHGWRESFDSFEEAYEAAEARASGKAALVICDERGKVILSTWIAPLPVELSKARARWRKLAFAD